MLDIIWAVMIITGIAWAAVSGRTAALTAGIITSARDAVELGVAMLGIMAFWSGILEMADRSGLVKVLSEHIYPLTHFLFPKLPKDSDALKHISTNMIANILGLGSAATPEGLKAMEELEKLEIERNKEKYNAGLYECDTASDEMCTFLIINISSLQLIPMNIIAYRSQYGSTDPASITGPAIAATIISTAVAVIFCKIMQKVGCT